VAAQLRLGVVAGEPSLCIAAIYRSEIRTDSKFFQSSPINNGWSFGVIREVEVRSVWWWE